MLCYRDARADTHTAHEELYVAKTPALRNFIADAGKPASLETERGVTESAEALED